MKWNILHESRGRIRLHLRKPRMSLAEADQLQDYLTSLPGVRTAAVYERTCDVVIVYTESRAGIVRGLAAFRFDTESLAEVPANSPRAVNREYQEKLVNMTIFHFARKLFLPAPLRMVYTLVRSVPPAVTAVLLVPVLLLARLIFAYRLYSVDPVLANYYLELLGLMLLILASYRLSGFAVQAGGPRMFGFYADLTAILAVTLLADGHSAALLPLGGAAALEGFQRAMRMSGAAKGKTEE